MIFLAVLLLLHLLLLRDAPGVPNWLAGLACGAIHTFQEFFVDYPLKLRIESHTAVEVVAIGLLIISREPQRSQRVLFRAEEYTI